jgi:hypothetical protein
VGGCCAFEITERELVRDGGVGRRRGCCRRPRAALLIKKRRVRERKRKRERESAIRTKAGRWWETLTIGSQVNKE